MKKSYILLALFALWCLVCAIWYVFGVKGASRDPALFSPQPMTVAIIEILVMILGGFMLGFGVSWLLREPAVFELREKLNEGRDHLIYKEREMAEMQSNAEVAERRVRQADERILSLINENESRLKDADSVNARADEAFKKLIEQENKLKTLDGESSSSRFRVRLLENELSEKEATIKTLRQEIDRKPAVEHRDWSDHPFVRPTVVDDDEKDNLTEIKGIGPAFQRKLNGLDIFSFRQLSELHGESVERLAQAIAVFPDRIHRDNWIGQASRLFAKKQENRRQAS
jgi:predicted flap endonuclease-1-like 5' DNA nuclease